MPRPRSSASGGGDGGGSHAGVTSSACRPGEASRRLRPRIGRRRGACRRLLRTRADRRVNGTFHGPRPAQNDQGRVMGLQMVSLWVALFMVCARRLPQGSWRVSMCRVGFSLGARRSERRSPPCGPSLPAAGQNAGRLAALGGHRSARAPSGVAPGQRRSRTRSCRQGPANGAEHSAEARVATLKTLRRTRRRPPTASGDRWAPMLHTALHSVGAGDEVLVAPCTLSPRSRRILMSTPCRLVDVDIDTYQMDPGSIEPLINSHTRGGACPHRRLPCDMERIMAIARKHGLSG